MWLCCAWHCCLLYWFALLCIPSVTKSRRIREALRKDVWEESQPLQCMGSICCTQARASTLTGRWALKARQKRKKQTGVRFMCPHKGQKYVETIDIALILSIQKYIDSHDWKLHKYPMMQSRLRATTQRCVSGVTTTCMSIICNCCTGVCASTFTGPRALKAKQKRNKQEQYH